MKADIPAGYSFAAWKAYCEACVRPQHTHPEQDPEQVKRLDRLLGQETASAWENLASDVTKFWPAHLEPLTWREALHNVIRELIFPMSPPPNPGTERADSYLVRMRKAGMGIPLLPATRTGDNMQRNWVALYLKTWIIPAFFNRKHYDEIATLVEVAWGSGEGLTADQVRLIRPFHFRKSYRQKTG